MTVLNFIGQTDIEASILAQYQRQCEDLTMDDAIDCDQRITALLRAFEARRAKERADG